MKKIDYTCFVTEDQVDQNIDSPKDGQKPGGNNNKRGGAKRVQIRDKDGNDPFANLNKDKNNNDGDKQNNNMLMEDGDDKIDEPASPAPHRYNITVAGLV